MPDEHPTVEELEAARAALEASAYGPAYVVYDPARPGSDVTGYAHIPMTDEEAARAKLIIAEDAERAAKDKATEERVRKPIDPYPIPLGAMLNSMYQRYSIDRRHKCQGKHVQARVARAKSKRAKSKKTPFNP